MAVSLIRDHAGYVTWLGGGAAANVSFDATGGSLLLVALRCDTTPGAEPTVAYAGTPMAAMTGGGIDAPPGSPGATRLFALELPASGTNNITVTAAAGEALGSLALAAWLLGGAALPLGDAGTAQGYTASLANSVDGTDPDGLLLGVVGEVYAALTPGVTGWTAGVDGGNSNAYMATFSRSSGAATVAFDATLTSAQYMQSLAFEVLPGTPTGGGGEEGGGEEGGGDPADPPENWVDSASSAGLLYPGSNGTLTLDCTGANYLLLMLTAGPALAGDTPLVSFGGYELTHLPAFDLANDTASVSQFWALELPPQEAATLTVVPGVDCGPCCLTAWAVANGDNAPGIVTAVNWGASATVTDGGVAGTSTLVGALHQIYANGAAAASGWTQRGDGAATYARASDWTPDAYAASATLTTTQASGGFNTLALIEFAEGEIEPPPDPPGTLDITVTAAQAWVTGGVVTASDEGAGSIAFDFMTPGVVPPTCSFRRASTAQYRGPDGLMHTAAVNEPAWQWDAEGNLLGAINEDADPETGRAADIWEVSISSARYLETYTRYNSDTDEVQVSTWMDDWDLDYLFRVRPSPYPLREFKLGPSPGAKDGAGIGGVVEARLPFDCAGGTLLIVACLVAWGAPRLPAISYGGRELRRVTTLDNSNHFGGHMALFALDSPPAGEHEIRAWSPVFLGQAIFHAIAVTGASGQMGARWIAADTPAAETTFHFSGTRASSRLFVLDASLWTQAGTVAADGAWTLLSHDPGDGTVADPDEPGGERRIQFGRAWLWTAPGGGLVPCTLTRSTDPWIMVQAIGFELYAALDQSADVEAATAWEVPALNPHPITGEVYFVTPSGQLFATYWESWMDREAIWPHRPLRRPAELADYNLTRIPPYVNRLALHASVPRSRYLGLDSLVYATTGLQVPADWTGHDLKAALDILRARRPDLELIVTVFQIPNAGDVAEKGEDSLYSIDREPYNAYGWGGMTDTHWANIKRFVDDMGLHGIELDYECSSQDPAVDKHCWTDEDGYRRCYTDTEIVAVVKKAREVFPRAEGYRLGQSFWHVGCFGEGAARYYVPGGYNSGGMLCLAKDPDTATALDFIHLMSYDASDLYDPVKGLASVMEHFPGVPAYIGLRVGTPEWGPTPAQQPRRSLNDFRHYLNAVLMTGAAGAHMYAMQWDLAEPSAAQYSPTGQYDETYPDGNMAARLVAQRFGRGYADVPLVGLRTPQLRGLLPLLPSPAGVVTLPPVLAVDRRLTESGDYRITESGDRRQVE